MPAGDAGAINVTARYRERTAIASNRERLWGFLTIVQYVNVEYILRIHVLLCVELRLTSSLRCKSSIGTQTFQLLERAGPLCLD